MRIGFVVPALTEGGGVPEVARFLLRVAARAGAAATVVSLETSSRGRLGTRLLAPRTWARGVTTAPGEWDGVPYTELGADWSELEFQRYRPRAGMRALLEGCNVVQVVCGSAAWANAAVDVGLPLSIQVATRAVVERRRRAKEATGLAEQWRKTMTGLTDRIERHALRRAHAVQVENAWMLDYVRNLNRDRAVDLRQAPPGIDAELFRPAASRASAADDYIFCVGRLDDPRKNIGLLLEAYALLPHARREQVRLVLAGSSGPPRAFWQRAEALGLRERVEFIHKPERAALVRLYQEAAVFALPSDEEGFGIALAEAMACGVAVVSTRCGGPEGVVSDGIDGFLVPLDDAAALADRIGRLLDDRELNRAMGQAARKSVETKFSEDAAGKAFVDVWQNLLTARNGHAR